MRHKLFFLDLETTGLKVSKHGIHQLAGMVIIDGEIKEKFNFKVAPHPKCIVTEEAMTINKVTEEQVRAYPPMEEVFPKMISLISKYIDRYKKEDKFHMVGYNNRSFDDQFFRRWFEHNNHTWFGSWFWSDSLDILVMASYYLMERRHTMPNFQLRSVAAEVGIEVDENRLHDAMYDIELTHAVYEIVTGREIEW